MSYKETIIYQVPASFNSNHWTMPDSEVTIDMPQAVAADAERFVNEHMSPKCRFVNAVLLKSAYATKPIELMNAITAQRESVAAVDNVHTHTITNFVCTMGIFLVGAASSNTNLKTPRLHFTSKKCENNYFTGVTMEVILYQWMKSSEAFKTAAVLFIEGFKSGVIPRGTQLLISGDVVLAFAKDSDTTHTPLTFKHRELKLIPSKG